MNYELGNKKCRGFEIVKDEHRKYKNSNIILPTRSDYRSAGYDIYLPCNIVLQPNSRILIFTDIKSYMMDDEVLMLYIRSSIGTKKGIVLSNGTGVIDSSYYNNVSNDGNIGLPLWNTTDKVVILKEGERIAQGIFMKYLISDNDNPINNERIGGFGSSGE